MLIQIIKQIMSWVFSIFFFLLSLGLFKDSPIAAISSLAVALILLPSFNSFIERKFNKSLPGKFKFIIVTALIILALATTKSTTAQNVSKEPNNPVEEKQIEESSASSAQQADQSSEKQYYKVTNVVDGDTIDVLIDGKTQRIRLIGIDTPEVVDPRQPVQCFGQEASDKTKSLLKDAEVSVEADPTQGDADKYNRLLRYVFIKDGGFLNEQLISEGYAHEYTYDVPYKYQQEFKEAENNARNNKLGLWADNACPTETKTEETKPVRSPSVSTDPVVTSTTSKTTTQNKDTQQPATASSKNSSTAQKKTQPYTCNCSKTCSQMSSCAEAQYQLNSCGCKARDGDHDGIACDSAPLHCQH